MALGVPEMCFWRAKTRKNLELFEMDTCHWPGAQIWFRHKWRKLVTASLLLDGIVGYSCFRYWNEFFSAVFQVFRQDCITCDAGNFTCSSQVKRSLAQFTCVTCSLPIITGKFTCFEAASTSRRIHAIAVNKARKLHVNSLAWCRLTYLQFAGEFTRVVMADCLQLQVILRGIAGFFACDCAGIVSCVCSYFCLRLAGIFTCDSSVFACRSRQFCMLVAGKFAWVPHVKLPVKYLWYSGKFTCARRQCACVPREVLAASKQVNLPVITGKPHVTQVKRARDLFTCELHAKLPAFAGNFARASFTVYVQW